jgi:hypothetical protein
MTVKTLINNVIFAIDESGSTHHLTAAINKVVHGLKDPLSAADQITRVSLYTFENLARCRFMLRHPDALTTYNHRGVGATALIDATYQAIEDHKKVVSGTDEDQAFLLYVITDGDENASRHRAPELQQLIATLSENWTVAILVPDMRGVHDAKRAGFPAGNIEVWDATSQRGVEDVGNRITQTYADYSILRTTGVRSSTRLFVNTKDLTTADVQSKLVEDTSFVQYVMVEPVAQPIRPYAEKVTNKPYQIGSCYYELNKPETIQGQKIIAIRNKNDGKIYSGQGARQMLGLPPHETNVKPGDFGDWQIFVQSTSVNRKLIPNQAFLLKQH